LAKSPMHIAILAHSADLHVEAHRASPCTYVEASPGTTPRYLHVEHKNKNWSA
jgi:hypothetical protein